ncbi:MAG TPA: TrkA family potassium uptake protein [Anaerolineales bacterium]|nr:TrkA family potassium uptake protein [Anaerolineales bacterium]
MFVIVVGGGNTGSQLAKFLLDAGHTVRVIDERPAVLEKLGTEIPQEFIINGDGSSPTVLEKVGVHEAQVLVAVTGSDETNLVVTSLGKFEFNVPRVIARVNNSKNAWLFTADMGVDVSLNQAEILARLTAEEMSIGDMMTMLKIRRGKYSLVEEKIAPNAPAIGKALKDLDLPTNCVISGIIRHGEIVMPRGITVLQEADEILALVDDSSRDQLAKLLSRPR